MRQVWRAAMIAGLVGFMGGAPMGIPAEAADLGPYAEPGYVAPPPTEGVPCVFEEGGPDIVLPWRSVWLGHFSGGRFAPAAYGTELNWKDEKVCFPSQGSCNRWISANRRAFHHPEGFWTCLPIR